MEKNESVFTTTVELLQVEFYVVAFVLSVAAAAFRYRMDASVWGEEALVHI